ncbi:MAG: Uma2 family endonuclease [bacterium]|nr:Uma2 family endonuclease [bacterium]
MAASNVHSAVQVNLVYELRRLTEYRIYTELSIVVDGVEYKPDVCAYPYRELDKKHDIIKMEELPVLAIEIVSPMQVLQKVVEKIDVYTASGIQSCWMVVPYPTTVTVYNGSAEKIFVEGNILDSITGIELPIAQIFQ